MINHYIVSNDERKQLFTHFKDCFKNSKTKKFRYELRINAILKLKFSVFIFLSSAKQNLLSSFFAAFIHLAHLQKNINHIVL